MCSGLATTSIFDKYFLIRNIVEHVFISVIIVVELQEVTPVPLETRSTPKQQFDADGQDHKATASSSPALIMFC